MASPLDLILGATQPLGQLAAAYEANQPVSGAKAQLLDYLYKSVNSGVMSPQEAQVMFQTEQQGVVPPPRAELMIPVQPQPAAGLSAQPGTAVNAIAAAPPAPAPTFAASPPVAPVAPTGLAAAPVPAPAPAAQPPSRDVVTPAEGGLAAAPTPATAPFVPGAARSAPEILGFKQPTIGAAQVEMDPNRYAQARQLVQQLGTEKKRPQIPLTMDMSKVRNKDFDMMRGALEGILKSRDASKMELEVFKVQAELARDEQKSRLRESLFNADQTGKAALAQAQLQQETDENARELLFKYYDLSKEMQVKEWAANSFEDEKLRGKFIALEGSLRGALAKVVGTAFAATPAGQAFIADTQSQLKMLEPFLRAWVKLQPGSGGVKFANPETGQPEVVPQPPAPEPKKQAAPAAEPEQPKTPKSGRSIRGSSVKTSAPRQPPAGMSLQQRIEWFKNNP
jgi:hypothetical protein